MNRELESMHVPLFHMHATFEQSNVNPFLMAICVLHVFIHSYGGDIADRTYSKKN